jgi:hypothetical protein
MLLPILQVVLAQADSGKIPDINPYINRKWNKWNVGKM